jgi:hypothetical protein
VFSWTTGYERPWLRGDLPGILERRGKPAVLPFRVLWFLFVGWWLGALWVVLSWSVLLVPYPFLDTVAALLDDLPSVMTLAYPATGQHGSATNAASS